MDRESSKVSFPTSAPTDVGATSRSSGGGVMRAAAAAALTQAVIATSAASHPAAFAFERLPTEKTVGVCAARGNRRVVRGREVARLVVLQSITAPDKTPLFEAVDDGLSQVRVSRVRPHLDVEVRDRILAGSVGAS